MLKLNPRLGLAVLLSIGLGLTACTTSPTTTAAPSTAGVVSTATSAPAATAQPTATATAEPVKQALSKSIRLDPALASDADSMMLNGYVYETLVREQNNLPQPGLAAAWTVSDDGLDYIFHLRPGVVFHNGTPLNADVVTANFSRWFDRDNPLHGNGDYTAWLTVFKGFRGETDADGRPRSTFDGIEKVDNLTVLIHLNRQDPDLLANLSLSNFSIIDPALLTVQGDKFGTSAETANGTGPYFVSVWDAGNLVLQPNRAYWGEPVTNDLQFELK